MEVVHANAEGWEMRMTIVRREISWALSEDNGRRRSNREVSRYVEIDGYKVLKLNNYSESRSQLFRGGPRAASQLLLSKCQDTVSNPMADVSSGKLRAPPSADDLNNRSCNRSCIVAISPLIRI